MYIYISKHRQKTLLFLADRPVLVRSGDQWLQPTNLHMTYSDCLDSIRVRGNNQVLRKHQLGLPARSGGLWDGSGFRNQVRCNGMALHHGLTHARQNLGNSVVGSFLGPSALGGLRSLYGALESRHPACLEGPRRHHPGVLATARRLF